MHAIPRLHKIVFTIITGGLIGLAGSAFAQAPPGEPSKTTITPYDATASPGPVRILPTPDSSFAGMYAARDGHEILPPRYYNIMGYEPADTLRDPIVYLMDSARNRYQEMGFTVLPGYEVKCGAFSRGGLLLYEPLWYDNGPDYWAEGRQRFVYNNKMGFVNRFGTVVVPARYPFVSPYRAGVAWACLDCTFKIVDSADREHGTAWVGTRWVAVDKDGKESAAQTLPGGPASTEDWALLSAVEARLAKRLLAGPDAAHFRRTYHLEDKELVVRVYDRPGAHSPYYHLALEVGGEGELLATEYQFLASPDGREVLHLAGPGMRVEGLEAWRRVRDAE